MFRQWQGAPNFRAVCVERRAGNCQALRPMYAEEVSAMGVVLSAGRLAFVHVDVAGSEALHVPLPWVEHVAQAVVDRCSVR